LPSSAGPFSSLSISPLSSSPTSFTPSTAGAIILDTLWFIGDIVDTVEVDWPILDVLEFP
jgi:hypothetical protein